MIGGQKLTVEVSMSRNLNCYLTGLTRGQTIYDDVAKLANIQAMGDSITESLESFQCDCEHFGLEFKYL